MSNRASQGATPSLILVLQLLARDWRSLWEKIDTIRKPAVGTKRFLTHPILALARLIERHTSFPTSDIQWMAWYSDRPFERTPPKPPGDAFRFPDTDPELDGFPEDYSTVPVL